MLELKNISKKLQSFEIRNINLKVERGKYFILLGQSGSGKSLILEIIAGLEKSDSGNIILNGKDITKEKMQNREIGLVFQDQAIFPHMTILENICYPLKIKHLSKKEIKQTAEKIAEEVNLSHILTRKADKLSGGEKQRVALARILALNPKCLLLDEPFASLDVQLKHEYKALLRQINKKGITIIHVTHDYEEAIALADEVAVIHDGEILQTGVPEHVFRKPKNNFVASFIGVRNYFKAYLTKAGNNEERTAIINDNLSFRLLSNQSEGDGFVLIRSKNIIISDRETHSSAINMFKARISNIYKSSQGYEIIAEIGVPISIKITKLSFDKFELHEGKEIWISFKGSSIRFIKD